MFGFCRRRSNYVLFPCQHFFRRHRHSRRRRPCISMLSPFQIRIIDSFSHSAYKGIENVKARRYIGTQYA